MFLRHLPVSPEESLLPVSDPFLTDKSLCVFGWRLPVAWPKIQQSCLGGFPPRAVTTHCKTSSGSICAFCFHASPHPQPLSEDTAATRTSSPKRPTCPQGQRGDVQPWVDFPRTGYPFCFCFSITAGQGACPSLTSPDVRIRE